MKRAHEHFKTFLASTTTGDTICSRVDSRIRAQAEDDLARDPVKPSWWFAVKILNLRLLFHAIQAKKIRMDYEYYTFLHENKIALFNLPIYKKFNSYFTENNTLLCTM
jgi:hypothetical protein